MKIKLKNFQSIKAEEIDFEPGLTLITGPTNSGKTAIFRGLMALLTNPAEAADFINGSELAEKGESAELVVSILDEDIPPIEFHRAKTKAWYMINNKKYSKLARSTIFDVYPEMHKKFIYNSDDPRKILNFQTENNLAFPFDRSDTEMFKLFEKIFNIADTRAIMDTIKKEEDETNFKLNQNLTEKANLQSSSSALQEILQKINTEFIHAYLQQYKYCSNQVKKYQSEIQTIANYAPLLQAAQELPSFSHKDDEIYERTIMLKKALEECRLKEAYIKNHIDIELHSSEEDFGTRVAELRAKLDKIVDIQSKMQWESSLIETNELAISEARKVLARFKTCPLCGHELEENND